MTVSDESVQTAVLACQAADDKKASDLAILEVGDVLGVVDVFALASTGSDRQLKAVADEVEHQLKDQHDLRPLRREGTPASGWVLLDYGDVVCHLFTAEQREFYDLDRLWGDVPRRDPLSGDERPPATAVATDAAAHDPDGRA